MSKLMGYCTGCGSYVYRLQGFLHGDGQKDTETTPIWLYAGDENELTEEEISLAEINKINCGCNK